MAKNPKKKAPTPEEAWEHNQAYALAHRHRIPREELTIPELTRRVNEHHAAVLRGVRTTLTAAKECGVALALIRTLLPHGKWGAWLKENFAASEYTAQRYMRIARDWHLLERLGHLDGPDLPGIARADALIQEFHQGLQVPAGTKVLKPPPGRLEQLVKNITGTLKQYVQHWPEEAADYLDSEMLAVIDSIEVYVQEHFGNVQYPDALPRIAIREKANEMKLIRAFVQRIGELGDEQQAELLRELDEPGALREWVGKADGAE